MESMALLLVVFFSYGISETLLEAEDVCSFFSGYALKSLLFLPVASFQHFLSSPSSLAPKN